MERPEPWFELAVHEDRVDRRKELRLPRCSMCGCIIDQYDMLMINGKPVCDACADDMRVPVEEDYYDEED